MSVTQLPDRTTYAPPAAAPSTVESPGPPAAEPIAEPRPAEWSAARRIGFRFAFAYLALYLFPFPLDSLPLVGSMLGWITSAQNWLAHQTEVHLFGLDAPVPIVPTGSGDTMAQWALQVDWLLIALAVTVVWSLLDRRRREYARLAQWLHVYVRFALATIMLGYGLAKVIPTQMAPPSLERLVQPFGEFSPMGVLWTFMGFSTVYQIFTGVGEALGALLLVFRRTATLGALLLVGVLANVALLNYTFDVPVKLFSTNLLLMALFVAAPDARRLFDALVLGRAVPSRRAAPLFTSARMRRIGIAAATLFVGFIVWRNTTRGLDYYRQALSPNRPKSVVQGIWDVEELTKNGAVQPPLLSDSSQIRRIVVGGVSRASFKLMSDSVERYRLTVDTTRRELTLTSWFDPKLVHTLTYARPDSGHLVLAGRVRGDSLVVRLRKFDERRFTLVNRGYNWIQERPYNR